MWARIRSYLVWGLLLLELQQGLVILLLRLQPLFLAHRRLPTLCDILVEITPHVLRGRFGSFSDDIGIPFPMHQFQPRIELGQEDEEPHQRHPGAFLFHLVSQGHECFENQ